MSDVLLELTDEEANEIEQLLLDLVYKQPNMPPPDLTVLLAVLTKLEAARNF